jgi:hypothetical protein
MYMLYAPIGGGGRIVWPEITHAITEGNVQMRGPGSGGSPHLLVRTS